MCGSKASSWWAKNIRLSTATTRTGSPYILSADVISTTGEREGL